MRITPLLAAFRLALYDLRRDSRRLILFILCLFLGVWMVALIGLMAESAREGIRNNARSLLGGDIEISQLHRPISAEIEDWVNERATAISHSRTLRSMASHGEDFKLVELKAIDGSYPLYSTLEVSPQTALPLPADGVLVDKEVLAAFSLTIGDTLKIGQASYRIDGIILSEPDRAAERFALGPRVMMSLAGLEASGLMQPGSLITYALDAKLPAQSAEAAVLEDLKQTFPSNELRLKDTSDAADGIKRAIDRLNLFLSFAALSSMLIGGVGIAQGTLSLMQQKRRSMAIMKASGLTRRQVLGVYSLQIGLVTALTLAAALAFAVLAEYAAIALYGAQPQLGVSAEFGIYPLPLLLATAIGLLGVIGFAAPILWQASTVSPATLLRGRDSFIYRFGLSFGSATLLCTLIAAFGGVAYLLSHSAKLAIGFTLGAAGCFGAFFFIARGIQWGLMRWQPRSLSIRLAVSNLTRPAAPTAGILTALGLGLSLAIALILVQQTLSSQLLDDLPAEAPAFFMVDIQPTQSEALQALVEQTPKVDNLQLTPMIRGRITAINGVPAGMAEVKESARWTLNSDRGFTFAATAPPANTLTEGEWWAPDYTGAPLLSMDEAIAEGYGVGIGDTVTVSLLGKEVTAKIHNLRRINWLSLRMNFVFIFSSRAFDGLPYSQLATVQAEAEAEDGFLRDLSRQFPNISTVRMRDTLQRVGNLIGAMALIVSAITALTLIIGMIVVIGALSATAAQRQYDSVILRMLGLTSVQLTHIASLEFLILGSIAGIMAVVIGSAIAAAIISLMKFFNLAFSPLTLLGSLMVGLLTIYLLGRLVTAQHLRAKPLALLRNE